MQIWSLTSNFFLTLQLRDLAEAEAKGKARKERDAQRARDLRDQQAAANARRAQEEEEESKKLRGRMLIFLNKAQINETPHAYSLSGLDLGGARTQILAKIVAFNDTLTTLHCARK